MTLPLLDIIGRYVSPSKSTSKQWCSPCVFCGGDDRFVILPYKSTHNGKEMPPHAFCRQCNAWCTAEMLLQRKEGISWHEAHAIVEGSKSIDDMSQGQQRYTGKTKKQLTSAEVEGAPWQEWQWAARGFARMCKAALWSEVGEKALQWLRDRGLSDETIDSHELGYCPQDHIVDWGTGEKIKLYRGIVIPYLGEDQLWKLEIRRATNVKKDRYRTIEGSANALYGYEGLAFRGKAVMAEGVFDALCMEQAMQEAGIEGVAVVATGSTDGSKVGRWKMKLSLCDRVIIAFDNDPDGAGDKAAEYWLKRLPDSLRWTPPHGDVNDTWLKDKAALVDACLSGFIPRKQCRVCALPSIDEDVYGRPWCSEHFPVLVENIEACEDYCFECGEDLDSFDIYGRAWCAMHAPGEPLPVVTEEAIEPIEENCQKPCYTITEEITMSTEPLEEPIQAQPTVITPAPPRKPKEKPKTSAMCDTEGCEGIARVFDATGGQWCPNCTLRRDLVDHMAQLGFPRLQYSPGHFVEHGEEQCVAFARTMSGTAVSLAIRACARLCAV